jgi:hypothetical protein
MFGKNKKHAIQIGLVTEDKSKDPTAANDPFIRPETVKLAAEKTKEIAKFVAVTAVAAYAAITVVDTLGKIALKKTKSADKED